MNIRRALVLTSDSTNLHKLAPFLQSQNVEIIATGKNLKYLRQHQVKTTALTSELLEAITFNDFGNIDLLIMNLNDIEAEISNSGSTIQSVVDNFAVDAIQILQAAATQYDTLITLINPSDYDDFIIKYTVTTEFTTKQRIQYAQKVFAHIAKYNELVAQYFYLSLMKV